MAPVLSAPSRLRRVNKLLARNERVVKETRRHWAQGFWPGVLAFGSAILVMILDSIVPLAQPVRIVLWLSWFAVLGYLVWRWIEWSMNWFVITDRRFMLAYGVFDQQVGMMPLPRVTDMRYERTWVGRMLGYGKFVLESAGQQQALSTVNFLPDSDRLYVEVCDLLFGDKSGGDGT